MSGLKARVVVRRDGFLLDVDFTAEQGETVSLLGPNGAGKSTLVEALAGVVPIDDGHIEIDGEVWAAPDRGVMLVPQARSVGVMFQGLLLFPALTAIENVAFGLRAQGESRHTARIRASELLERFGVAELAGRRPDELSGGQAQRVALARALAAEPMLLLLDEPMSALDIENRAAARRHLRDVLSAFGGVKLVITHEPIEALALADRVVIIEEGAIVQAGTPDEIRRRPRSRYVASLVGVNLVRGVVDIVDGHRVLRSEEGDLFIAEDVAARTRVMAAIHPRAVTLMLAPDPHAVSARNVFSLTVADIDRVDERVRVRLEGRPPLVAEVTPDAVEDLGLRIGGQVWAALKATHVDVYPE